MMSFLVSFLLFSSISIAQETTSNLNGTVTDEKGTPVQGASVVLKHEPTGAVFSSQTNKKGAFVLPNLKPGGPYTIVVSFSGFKKETIDSVNLSLGNNPALDVALKLNTQSMSTVVVTATKRTPSGVGRLQLATLPTIGRSISDFTRLTPQSNNNSFAGSNFRYNNLTIDGAINNDAIGFSNSFGGTSGGGQSGAAGAGTRTNPYSLDVIQEVQVQLAPYDVKLGNFTGGSVNAVTKSGSNDFHGTLYAYGRNSKMIGKSPDSLKSAISNDFYENQYGATLSGPIIHNKAFFIVNFEETRRQEPTFYNAGDPGAAISIKDADSIKNRLAYKYGYDVGTYTQKNVFTNSDKLFARLDFNLSPKNTLTLRGIYTNGSGNNIERTTTNFQFSSTDFIQHTVNLNLVGELKTRFNNELNNLLTVSYINVHEYRDFPGVLSPFMDIGSGTIWAGTWREASIYNMKQKTIEISDNLTLTKGNHKFTFGTHNEFYNLTYGFVNSWNGRWEYASVGSFLQDKPSRIRGAYSTNSDYPNDRNSIYNNPPNPFNVALLSVYAQDEYTFNKRFKITPGIRVDYARVGNQPTTDSSLNKISDFYSASPTYTHTPFAQLNNKWLDKATISPRIGFTWDINGNQSVVVRGGSGIFVGRMPFAWLGYAYTLNGSTYGNIDFKPSASNTVGGNTVIPLSIDPRTLQSDVNNHALASANAANTREVDIIDNNFKLPTIWRSSLAVDLKFGKGYKATFDAMYTKTLYDVKFQQINIKDSVQYFADGPSATPVYVGGKLYSKYSNAYFLTNTTEGYRYNLTAQISRNAPNMKWGHHLFNYNWSVAYTYGVSKDISNGIRNSFQSNYELNPSITPGNSTLAYSNFDLRHRIVATLGGNLIWNEMNSTFLTFFFSDQSGNPYSVVYASAGNPFSNSANANLPYIPKDKNDIRLAPKTNSDGTIYTADQQWNDLNNFISNDKYLSTRRGQYAERNGLHTPWNSELDLKLMHEFKLNKKYKSHALQVSFDLFNVLNLLNNSWGHVTFVTNTNNYTVNLLTFAKDANNVAPGKPSSGYLPTFNFNKPTGTDGQYYTIDPMNSRWQGQFGIKFIF